MFAVDDSFFDEVANRVVRRIRSELSLNRQPALVNGDTLAELLSISRPTVDRLRRDGIIPSIKLGPRCRRYNVNAVIQTLERRHVITE